MARKRKRQHGVTHTQIKKQQQQQQCSPAAATNDVPAVKVSIMEEPMPSSPLASLDAINHVDSSGSGLNDIQVDGVANDNDLNFDSSIKEINEKNELDLKLSELKGGIATKETSVDRSGDGLTSGFSAANGTESLQSGRCTGAKRRKPASVRRFKPETASGVMNDSQDALPNATSGPFVAFTQEGIHDHGFVGNALGCKNKWDDSKDACAIAEIIKPMSYSASVSSDFQDVFVTFLAKRSVTSRLHLFLLSCKEYELSLNIVKLMSSERKKGTVKIMNFFQMNKRCLLCTKFVAYSLIQTTSVILGCNIFFGCHVLELTGFFSVLSHALSCLVSIVSSINGSAKFCLFFFGTEYVGWTPVGEPL